MFSLTSRTGRKQGCITRIASVLPMDPESRAASDTETEKALRKRNILKLTVVDKDWSQIQLVKKLAPEQIQYCLQKERRELW